MTESSATQDMTNLKVISVGNDLYGDDGVGVQILDQIKNEPVFENVSLIDCATDALNIVEEMKSTRHMVIIDAAKMSTDPGTVKIFDAKDVHLHVKSDHLSVHGISLVDTFNIAQQIGVYPESLTIIGIEPEQIAVNSGLSNTVLNAIPLAISKLIKFQTTLNIN